MRKAFEVWETYVFNNPITGPIHKFMGTNKMPT
jgi:hypothetical protein